MKGQIVNVRVYGGKIVQRRLIVKREKVTVICHEDEWQRAIRERREPEGLGFPHEDVEVTDAALLAFVEGVERG